MFIIALFFFFLVARPPVRFVLGGAVCGFGGSRAGGYVLGLSINASDLFRIVDSWGSFPLRWVLGLVVGAATAEERRFVLAAARPRGPGERRMLPAPLMTQPPLPSK